MRLSHSILSWHMDGDVDVLKFQTRMAFAFFLLLSLALWNAGVKLL